MLPWRGEMVCSAWQLIRDQPDHDSSAWNMYRPERARGKARPAPDM
jgi:hypothetical protein